MMFRSLGLKIASAGKEKGFSFMRLWRIWFAFSTLMIVVSVTSILLKGFNLGIDFTGGVSFDLAFQRPVSTSEVREVLSGFGLGGSSIVLDEKNPSRAFIRTVPIDEERRKAVLDALSQRVSPVTSEEVHLVSPAIARDLVRLALLALGIAIVGMLIYISFRFDFKFAVAGIIALLHDPLITLGMFSLFGLEVSSPFIAAVLTIAGYSINDTIVIFDRIRENLKGGLKKGVKLDELADSSIYETLPRSINTVLTTLLPVIALVVLGGKTTREFSLALLIGISFGAYSSIFLASPIWVLWKSSEAKPKAKTKTPQKSGEKVPAKSAGKAGTKTDKPKPVKTGRQ